MVKKTKLLFLILIMLLATALSGCGTLFQNPDPELEGINTKEEALELMTSKVKQWNYIKGKAKLSIIPLPYEGHVDIRSNLAYLEKTGKKDDEKIVENYYYVEGEVAYVYELKDDLETYKHYNLAEKLSVDLDLSNYLDLIEPEKINLDKVEFEKDVYHVSFSFNVKVNGKTYDVELNYGNSKFQIIIEDFASITLEKDNPDFFKNLEINLDNFQK